MDAGFSPRILPSPGIFSLTLFRFQIPSEDDTYIVGWSRLTDHMGILPTRLEAPKTKSNIQGLTRHKEWRVQVG